LTNKVGAIVIGTASVMMFLDRFLPSFQWLENLVWSHKVLNNFFDRFN
jgi:hypothetical protein